MAELKTRPTGVSVSGFLQSIKDDRIRADCRTIAAIMKQATKANPKLWGSNLVGFGTRRIKYAGGREADWMRIAFAPRKDKITLYVNSGFKGYRDLRAKLGKTSGGKACIHIRSLSDVDLPTLRKLVAHSIKNLD
ncbi:MAG TPA: DUF1801 domain-containing protein [Vicinamibacterales bacterium]|jgi:hypothetical protein